MKNQTNTPNPVLPYKMNSPIDAPYALLPMRVRGGYKTVKTHVLRSMCNLHSSSQQPANVANIEIVALYSDPDFYFLVAMK